MQGAVNSRDRKIVVTRNDESSSRRSANKTAWKAKRQAKKKQRRATFGWRIKVVTVVQERFLQRIIHAFVHALYHEGISVLASKQFILH
jgi:hypothetical protein